MSINPSGTDNPFLSVLLKNKDIQDELANLSLPVSTQTQIIPAFFATENSNESANAALNHVASQVKGFDETQPVQTVNNYQTDTEPFVVKVSVKDFGEERWSSKIDPQEITRQTYINAAMQMGLSQEQANKFADEYAVENPFVVDGDEIRQMKRSDLDNVAIVYKNTDEWGRYQSVTSESLLKAIQDYKAKLQNEAVNQGATETTPMVAAGVTTVMPSQPINLELPKVVPAVIKAAPVLAEAAVPAAMLGAGVAAQGKVLYDWGQIEYARQALNAKTSVMPLPPLSPITANPTDTKTPVVPDTSIPTDEELPKGELTKAGPATTSAPTTSTAPNISPISPISGPGREPDKIPPIVGPIIGGITATIGILAGSSSTTEPERTQPVRVAQPGIRPDLYRSYKSNADVPDHYSKDTRFNALASDPDQGGKITPKTRAEAMAGLEAESQGLLKKPIERGPKGIEFYDADGTPWDVKTPPSPNPGDRWSFDIDEVGNSILDELRKKATPSGAPAGTYPHRQTGKPESRRVILDSTYVNDDDHKALWEWLNKNLTEEELSRIVEITTRP